MFLHFLLIVLVNVEEISGVEPGHREKIVLPLPREFFAETTQMYAESIFPGNVIHTEKVIDALPGKKCAEPLWCEATIIKPVNVPRRVVSLSFVWSCYHQIAGSLLGV
jgi:hypothetical protein